MLQLKRNEKKRKEKKKTNEKPNKPKRKKIQFILLSILEQKQRENEKWRNEKNYCNN